MEEQILEMPVVVVHDLTVVPATTVHLNAKKAETIQAVETCLKDGCPVLIATMREPKQELTIDNLYPFGVVGQVKQLMRLAKDLVSVRIDAQKRARLLEITDGELYDKATVAICEENVSESLTPTEQEAYLKLLKDVLYRAEHIGGNVSEYMHEKLSKTDDIVMLLYTLCEYMNISVEKKQEILAQPDFRKRLDTFLLIANNEFQVLDIKSKLNEQLNHLVSDNQKEYVLREQMRAIKEELGEDDTDDDAKAYMDKLNALSLSDEVKERLMRDIKRFSNISPMSSESTVIRTYIETILSYPWGKKKKLTNRLSRAIQILDRDHYGLKKVKERVIDTLASQMLSKNMSGPILCLVGPPGTGKTSIAKSIAEATGRSYERICLGGVHDEAELRGHRKTYVGAMPGRVADAMIHAKNENPLILLDEVDKMSRDYKGDAEAALLEILDGEQNSHFVDHYFEVPLDLSNVLFIATANDAGEIAKPLLDRMEVIEVSGYTANEKLHIADCYLVTKQIKKNGLTKRQFKIDEEALEYIISAYTREAGVRQLERTIGRLTQKAARSILSGEVKSFHVTKEMLPKLLGPEKYRQDETDLADKVGSVTGLAWTSLGGETLEVEVNICAGRGNLKLTGNLGDVMKESANIALSYVRSLLCETNENENESVKPKKHFFEKHDIHVHVPEGAVPKDGPSAGVTMATAIYSAVTKCQIRGDIAMTGEITLRGNVLAIGGLKEKLLAAKKAGKKEVILPKKNEPDVAEIDDEILQGMKITYVSHVKEVISHARV